MSYQERVEETPEDRYRERRKETPENMVRTNDFSELKMMLSSDYTLSPAMLEQMFRCSPTWLKSHITHDIPYVRCEGVVGHLRVQGIIESAATTWYSAPAVEEWLGANLMAFRRTKHVSLYQFLDPDDAKRYEEALRGTAQRVEAEEKKLGEEMEKEAREQRRDFNFALYDHLKFKFRAGQANALFDAFFKCLDERCADALKAALDRCSAMHRSRTPEVQVALANLGMKPLDIVGKWNCVDGLRRRGEKDEMVYRRLFNEPHLKFCLEGKTYYLYDEAGEPTCAAEAIKRPCARAIEAPQLIGWADWEELEKFAQR